MEPSAAKTETGRRWSAGRVLWSILRIAVGVYVGLCVLLFLFQGRLLYHPDDEIAYTPARLRLDYDEVALTTEDGVRLAAWYVPAEAPRGTVLFCHGNAGNMSHRLSTIEVWNGLGWNLLLFDYRGYGRSEGSPDEEGTYRDAEAAWQYLTAERGVAGTDLLVHGRSLGGAVAAWVAVQHPPKAVILESTFTSVPDAAARLWPGLPVRWLARYEYGTLDRVSRLACPVLIIHSRGDDLLPYAHGRALFEAASPPKQFLEIHGPHGSGFVQSGAQYTGGLEDFLARHVATGSATTPR